MLFQPRSSFSVSQTKAEIASFLVASIVALSPPGDNAAVPAASVAFITGRAMTISTKPYGQGVVLVFPSLTAIEVAFQPGVRDKAKSKVDCRRTRRDGATP